MLESMEQLIRELELLPAGCTVVCAVSGGADSICLLHALYRLRPRLGFSLAAAHYNHRLRGAESERDAAFTADFVRRYCGPQPLPQGGCLPAVPLFTGSGDVAARSATQGTGLEETARELRYAFLQQTARELGGALIATAHTADDNGETMLFHLARGSGLQGLQGIQPRWGNLIRPLLTTSRREVLDYLDHWGLPHVEDGTNGDDAFARNRIRHQVVPVLEELYPGLALRLARTAALLRADEDYLSAQAGALSQQAQVRGEALTLSAALIGEAPDPLAARAVRQLLARLSGDRDWGQSHLEGVVRLCRGSDPSAQIDLPRGLIARREYGLLVLSPRREPAPLEPVILPLPGERETGEWRITCTAQVYGGQPQSPWDFWLDRARIDGLTLRPRATGDRLKLPGRPEKTVKKWCVDEKIPARLRAALPVLLWGNRVAGVAGLGPAEPLLPRTGEEAWHISIRPRSGGEIILGKEASPC